jgi:hypothetical protein
LVRWRRARQVYRLGGLRRAGCILGCHSGGRSGGEGYRPRSRREWAGGPRSRPWPTDTGALRVTQRRLGAGSAGRWSPAEGAVRLSQRRLGGGSAGRGREPSLCGRLSAAWEADPRALVASGELCAWLCAPWEADPRAPVASRGGCALGSAPPGRRIRGPWSRAEGAVRLSQRRLGGGSAGLVASRGAVRSTQRRMGGGSAGRGPSGECRCILRGQSVRRSGGEGYPTRGGVGVKGTFGGGVAGLAAQNEGCMVGALAPGPPGVSSGGTPQGRVYPWLPLRRAESG